MTDELENELKPCPFCGGQVHRIAGDDENAHDIECDGCAYIFYDLSEGNNWWNDRPIEDALEEAAIKQAEEIYKLTNLLLETKKDSEYWFGICEGQKFSESLRKESIIHRSLIMSLESEHIE